MRTAEFVKRICQGRYCPKFDRRWGCKAYDGEECDKAFRHPHWRGMSMRDRVDAFCEAKSTKEKEK